MECIPKEKGGPTSGFQVQKWKGYNRSFTCSRETRVFRYRSLCSHPLYLFNPPVLFSSRLFQSLLPISFLLFFFFFFWFQFWGSDDEFTYTIKLWKPKWACWCHLYFLSLIIMNLFFFPFNYSFQPWLFCVWWIGRCFIVRKIDGIRRRQQIRVSDSLISWRFQCCTLPITIWELRFWHWPLISLRLMHSDVPIFSISSSNPISWFEVHMVKLRSLILFYFGWKCYVLISYDCFLLFWCGNLQYF